MAVAIVLGAYASHGLAQIAPLKWVHSFQIANQYHIYHSVALCIIGSIWKKLHALLVKIALYFFVGGLVFFSFDIYVHVFCKLFSWDMWANITMPLPPIGGVCFVIAWVVLAFAARVQMRK